MREIKVDWAALHSAFQSSMPEVRCFLCCDDGQVLKMLPGDSNLSAVRSQPMRYLLIEPIASRIQYQWLDDFLKTLDSDELRSRFQSAANGKGAFRRFKDILLTMPEERRHWFEFRDQKMRQRIVEWIREQGIVPLNEPPWLESGVRRADNTPVKSLDHNDGEALGKFVEDWAKKHEFSEWLEEIDVDDLVAAASERFKFVSFFPANRG